MTSQVSAKLVRERISALRSVAHGSAAASELADYGFTPATALDFSVNTNPLGPAPVVLKAIHDADWTRYPGDDEAPLRCALAVHLSLNPDQLALGNGSAELIWSIALALLEPGDRVVIVGPTFGEYARAAQVVGAVPAEVHELSEAADARVVFVCNPNNPTGVYYDRASIERFLTEVPDRLVVIDEAYASFVEHRWSSGPLLREHANLIILRSLTKDHALPGLRLGYALAAPEIAHALDAVRPPWSVNAGALCAGLATLHPTALAHVARAALLVSDSRRMLTTGLGDLGFKVHPSSANFLLVEVGDAAAFRGMLLQRGIVVRDCTSFGLPSCVRIACRLPEECQQLLQVVESLHLR